MGRWEDLRKTLDKKGMLDGWKQEYEQRGIQQGMQQLLDLWKKGVSLADAEKMILARQ